MLGSGGVESMCCFAAAMASSEVANEW